MSLVAELRRRNVFRVAIAYLAGSWLLIQVADTVVPAFGWPETTVGIFITILAIGFVPALVVAWVFELTPEGLVRDEEIAADRSVTSTTARVLDRAIMVALALAVTYFAVDKFVFAPPSGPNAAYDKSIAVLPFDDMSADADQRYFSDGITEEILNALAQIEKLRVVSRSSSFTYRGPVVVSEVAKALDVSYVLEGSVRKAGNKVRVTAQLIDAVSDAHVWSETFERELIDIFNIQDDIAETVSERLEVAIAKRHREPQKTDPDTYALYLKARHSFYSQTGNFTDYAEEIRLLRTALERDPEFVPAMTLLVDMIEHVAFENREYREDLRMERMQLIRDAYALDPDDALANMYMGWNRVEETGDFAAGIPYLERSLRLEPSNVEVLRTAAYVAGELRRVDDAMMLIGEALKRDPLCVPCATMATRIALKNSRWEDAEAVLRRRIELDNNDVGGRINLAFVMMETGRAEEALAIIDEYEPEEAARLAFRGMALDKLGRHEEADASIAQMREQFGDDFFKLIFFYAGRQDVVQTLHWIGQAVDQDPRLVKFLQGNGALEFLADEPEWQQWIDELGEDLDYLAAIEFEIPDLDSG